MSDTLLALRIERDNLDAAREWAVKRLYPYVMEKAGPLPVPLERIAELAAQRIDELARQQPPCEDWYAIAMHPDGTSTDLKKPYCRDCGSNSIQGSP